MSTDNPCKRLTDDPMLARLPPFEPGVVFQSFSSDREGQLSGFRVFADGRYERMQSGAAWTPFKTLPAANVESLKTAIAEAGLASLAGVYAPARLPDDGTYNVVQTSPDAKTAIVLHRPCRLDSVDALYKRVAALL